MYELNLYAKYRSIFVRKFRSRWESCILAEKKLMSILGRAAQLLPSFTYEACSKKDRTF